MNKISIPPLSEYYNFDRLEDAARELHLNTEEQENEEKYTYHIDDAMHDVCCAYGFFGTDRC